MHFFNLLTSPELPDELGTLLPECRERRYPPAVALAMFLGQVSSADGSCQNAVNEAVVSRLLSGPQVQSTTTGAYRMTRERLPQEMVRGVGALCGSSARCAHPGAWRWRGRPVKWVDDSATLMADTVQNQKAFPQHSQQERGAGFSIARLVGGPPRTTERCSMWRWTRTKARERVSMVCSSP